MLRLEENGIGDEGAEAFAKTLTAGKLRTLYLDLLEEWNVVFENPWKGERSDPMRSIQPSEAMEDRVDELSNGTGPLPRLTQLYLSPLTYELVQVETTKILVRSINFHSEQIHSLVTDVDQITDSIVVQIPYG